MSFGYCNLSFIPGRAEPSDKSEMTNQVLFGEYFEIIDENDKWFKIKLDHDEYECWVDKKQVQVLSDADEDVEDSEFLVDELYALVENQSIGSNLSLVMGSLIPPHSNGAFSIGGVSYQFDGAICSYNDATLDKAAEYAMRYINTPYLWGGRTPFGIDCSGLTQMVFRMCGIALSRDSHEQAEEGEVVEHLENVQEGDLAFFQNDEGRITHVGIVLNAQDGEGWSIIHASGKVRIDKLDEKGIYNTENQNYSHVYHSVRAYD